MDDHKIPLRNKNGEIVDYAFVSLEDYENVHVSIVINSSEYCLGIE